MKNRKNVILCICAVLVLVLAAGFLLRPDEAERSLFLQLGKPSGYDENGQITAQYTAVHTERESLDILLLSMINAEPIDASEVPTAPPDARITVRYGEMAYPYDLWLYEDHAIFGGEGRGFRKILNDHNDPVPLLKELIESIPTE